MPNENTMKKTFTDNLNRLLRIRSITQAELATYMEVSNTTVNNWVKGYKVPRMDKVDKLCSFFKIKRSELLEQSPAPASDDLPALTQRDERQIAKDLEDMLHSLKGSAAMGELEDEEDMELLKASLLQAMTLSKRIAKKKFTPKKYRK